MGHGWQIAIFLLVTTLTTLISCRIEDLAMISPLIPPLESVIADGPWCMWKLPEKLNDEFSVSCLIPSSSIILMSRRLCVHPYATQPESSKNLSTSRWEKNGVIRYKLNGTYDPSQVGIYLLTIVTNDVRSPFPQVILPIVRIEANRQQRRARDLVTCIVEGTFVQGNLSLVMNGRIVLTVSAASTGYYRSPDGQRRATVIHTNDTVTFRLSVSTTPWAERRYSCRFLVPSCVIPAASEPLTLSSKEVNIQPHYVTDGHPTLQVARLCCHYTGPHPESMVWRRSTDCTKFETVSQYIRDGYDGYLLGRDQFVSRMDLRPRWDSEIRYNSTYCLSSIMGNGLKLPPGDYQCVVRNEYEVIYERSITLPGHVIISMKLEGPLLHIGCRFRYRVSGQLDIERIPDGIVVYTLALGDNLSLNTDPQTRIFVNGSEVSVEVMLRQVLIPGSAFRCRVSDKCEVKSSEIINAVPPIPQQKTPSKAIVQSPDKQPITEGYELNPETIEDLRRWTYVSSAVATIFIIAVFIVIRFY